MVANPDSQSLDGWAMSKECTMFRRRSTGQESGQQQLSFATRLQALGELLDERRYVQDGLCILASESGFIVIGYAMPGGGSNFTVAQQTLEVTTEMLAEVLARHRGGK